MSQVFTPAEVQRVVGVSYRQIQYFDKSGKVVPARHTSGRYRRYAFPEIVTSSFWKEMRGACVGTAILRQSMPVMAELLKGPQHQVNLVAVAVDEKDMLIATGLPDFRGQEKPAHRYVIFTAASVAAQMRSHYPSWRAPQAPVPESVPCLVIVGGRDVLCFVAAPRLVQGVGGGNFLFIEQGYGREAVVRRFVERVRASQPQADQEEE